MTPLEDQFDGSGDVETQEPRNTCRADDTVQCSDGSAFICADQVCDGTPDCDDGGDELNCLHLGKNYCSVVLTVSAALW